MSRESQKQQTGWQGAAQGRLSVKAFISFDPREERSAWQAGPISHYKRKKSKIDLGGSGVNNELLFPAATDSDRETPIKALPGALGLNRLNYSFMSNACINNQPSKSSQYWICSSETLVMCQNIFTHFDIITVVLYSCNKMSLKLVFLNANLITLFDGPLKTFCWLYVVNIAINVASTCQLTLIRDCRLFNIC